jgi:apolipoprotein D and lipocalin family protein
MRLLVILLFLGACSNMSYNKTVEKLDIDRFMGKWYVIAARYTIFEEGAHNSVEYYTWNEKEKRIDVDFRMRKGSFDGVEKAYPQKAWIHNTETNAHLKIQFFWPFKFDFWLNKCLKKKKTKYRFYFTRK